jgi:DNA-binding response OmpR family regulator
MKPTHAVLLQSDPKLTQTLATSLSGLFYRVHIAGSLDDLRQAAAEHRPTVIIVDLETASLQDVESLKRDFRETHIVCNHRIADEEMWALSLDVGADDCLPSSDMSGILFATVRETTTGNIEAPVSCCRRLQNLLRTLVIRTAPGKRGTYAHGHYALRTFWG